MMRILYYIEIIYTLQDTSQDFTTTIFIEGIKWEILSKLIQFIYLGYTNVTEQEGRDVVDAAKTLQVRGLVDLAEFSPAISQVSSHMFNHFI